MLSFKWYLLEITSDIISKESFRRTSVVIVSLYSVFFISYASWIGLKMLITFFSFILAVVLLGQEENHGPLLGREIGLFWIRKKCAAYRNGADLCQLEVFSLKNYLCDTVACYTNCHPKYLPINEGFQGYTDTNLSHIKLRGNNSHSSIALIY